MPLGVEHVDSLGRLADYPLLFKPLMPLGVEHLSRKATVNPLVELFKPLMPLGVEHTLGELKAKYGNSII